MFRFGSSMAPEVVRQTRKRKRDFLPAHDLARKPVTTFKSELAVGYCTLYGDMSGGLAVISDVPKTMIYRLAHWLNRARAVIPSPVLTKAPSAELRPNQTDQDSLPPYDLLDDILERHVEHHQSAEEIVAQGFDEATVRRVLHLVRTAEFKRKQAAPGIKVTDRAFGVGWRVPIARKEWTATAVRTNSLALGLL
ncbi:MAG: NAD(+) synthase [Acidobacteriia bacterium]|nr:NAD(+) synthase [Terriglobia bacterium]